MSASYVSFKFYCTISICEKCPLEYTSAFGTVPIGNINANDVAIVIGSARYSGCSLKMLHYKLKNMPNCKSTLSISK